MTEPELVTVEYAVQLTGRSRWTIRQAIARGDLHAETASLGATRTVTLIRRDALMAWAAAA